MISFSLQCGLHHAACYGYNALSPSDGFKRPNHIPSIQRLHTAGFKDYHISLLTLRSLVYPISKHTGQFFSIMLFIWQPKAHHK